MSSPKTCWWTWGSATSQSRDPAEHNQKAPRVAFETSCVSQSRARQPSRARHSHPALVSRCLETPSTTPTTVGRPSYHRSEEPRYPFLAIQVPGTNPYRLCSSQQREAPTPVFPTLPTDHWLTGRMTMFLTLPLRHHASRAAFARGPKRTSFLTFLLYIFLHGV
jgi:hypothetical protein